MTFIHVTVIFLSDHDVNCPQLCSSQLSVMSEIRVYGCCKTFFFFSKAQHEKIKIVLFENNYNCLSADSNSMQDVCSGVWTSPIKGRNCTVDVWPAAHLCYS